MALLTTRIIGGVDVTVKDAPLTNLEVDTNFNNLVLDLDSINTRISALEGSGISGFATSYWNCDDSGPTVVADSIGGLNGTATGTLGFGDPGLKNTCITINNNSTDKVVLPNITLSNVSEFSIAWATKSDVKLANSISTNQFKWYISSSNSMQVALPPNGATFQVGLRLTILNPSTIDGDFQWTSDNLTYDISTWRHFVLTFNSGVCKGYTNGVEIPGTVTISGATEFVGGTTTFHEISGFVSDFPPEGSWYMDEVQTYDIALTSQQVSDLYAELTS